VSLPPGFVKARATHSDLLDENLYFNALGPGLPACVQVPELLRRSDSLETAAHAAQSPRLISAVSLASRLRNAMVGRNVTLGKYIYLNTLRIGRPACAHVPLLRCRAGVRKRRFSQCSRQGLSQLCPWPLRVINAMAAHSDFATRTSTSTRPTLAAPSTRTSRSIVPLRRSIDGCPCRAVDRAGFSCVPASGLYQSQGRAQRLPRREPQPQRARPWPSRLHARPAASLPRKRSEDIRPGRAFGRVDLICSLAPRLVCSRGRAQRLLSKKLIINTLYLGRPASAHVPPLSFPLRRSKDGR